MDQVMRETNAAEPQHKCTISLKNALAIFMRGSELTLSQENLLRSNGMIDQRDRLTEKGEQTWAQINRR